MWLKLFFLLLYFSLLFALARVIEEVVWYETGAFATQLVDPVSLSYEQLKTILEVRGLGHSGLEDRSDVSDLVQESGDLTQGELYFAIKKEKEQKEAGDVGTTLFSGETHFYELVEDTKDGIWLVQVVAQEQEALLSQTSWGKMVQKVSRFGIRTGTFNCSSDQRSCIKRGWQRSTLIMSAPLTSASKGKVMLKEYDGRFVEAESVFRWMTSHVAHRVKTLRRPEQLLEEWRSEEVHPVKMFLFARLAQPPAFFSSLSVKFTGRIDFIFVDIRHWNNHSTLLDIGVTQSPAYILKMPEGIYRYGNSTGEFLSLAALDTFLCSVQPEVNDLFVLSLVLINLLAWMDLFITQGATVKRFVVLIRTLGTYNSILLVSWLPVVALLQLPSLDTLYSFSLKLLRFADTTTLAGLVRADWTFYSSHPALFLSTYLAHGLLVDYFVKKCRCGTRSQEDSSTNLEWLASLWDWYASYLLHPIASFQQPPSDSDWEDDPSFFFERLAFPDLWLRPLINMDYMKALPTWRLTAGRHRSCVSCEQRDKGTDPDPEIQDAHIHHSKSSSPCCHRGNCRLSSVGGDLTTDGTSEDQYYHWTDWPANVLSCSECVVCLEAFQVDELLMGLPCGHAFHQKCIMVWLAAGRHCCPVCRWPSYKHKPLR